MKQFQQFGSLLLWVLQGILLIILVFQEQFTVPLAGLGRLHPLVLHLPIGFGILLVLLWLIRKQIDAAGIIFEALLLLTALFSTLTAILGLFLSREGDYDASQLSWHLWSGVAVSFLYFSWAIWKRQQVIGAFAGLTALVFAGHTGASITHGADYLQFGTQEQSITEESIAFEALVQPILKAKCESCHNDQKSKGGLKMNSVANLLKGGKNGPIWKAGDLNSHLIQRIQLPLSHKKHMPPAGKAQLTADEQLILTLWIKEGANMQRKVKEFSPAFQKLTKTNTTDQPEKEYDFAAASTSDIEAVNTPFCTVFPIANESPALQANFFVAAKFDLKTLENLQKVEKQLIGLNLNKMPISDAAMPTLTKFSNVEKLLLNGTKVTDQGIKSLAELPKLNELSLSSTSVSKGGIINLLKGAKSLKKIYLWNTQIKKEEFTQLRSQFPKVYFEEGVSSTQETLQINPPILVNEKLILRPNEQLQFKHTLRDVVFRYTLNDSLPDSLSGLQSKRIVPIQNYTKVRIIATKPGWYASNPVDVKVYKSNFVPEAITLLSNPAPNYPAHGGSSLMDFEQGAREVKGVPNLTWLGFYESDLDAIASFTKPTKVKGITFSFLEKTDSDVFPPTKIEIWAGNDPKNLRLLTQISPKQPTEKSGYSLKGINIPVQAFEATYYRIKAHRLKKLPSFSDQKGKNAWLRVDEILFY